MFFGVLWGPRKRLPFLGVINTGSPKTLAVFGVKTTGSPKMLAFLGIIKMAAQNVNFVASGQVGFPHKLPLVADGAVSL